MSFLDCSNFWKIFDFPTICYWLCKLISHRKSSPVILAWHSYWHFMTFQTVYWFVYDFHWSAVIFMTHFHTGQPYPTPRTNGAFIGAALHNPPIQPVLKVPCPESCRPHNLTGPLALADWSFCWKLFVSSIWKSGMLSRWWLIWQNCSCDWIYSSTFFHI
jgi:hypothetical protein